MITNEGLKLLGFKPLPPGQSITASFWLLRVYSALGFTLPPDAAENPEVFESQGVRFVFANSINTAAQALFQEDYTADEEAWQREAKGAPPYLVLTVGPTAPATITSGYFQRVNGGLVTHDCFAQSKQELSTHEPEFIDPAIAAISMSLAHHPYPVTLKQVAREVAGKTTTGESLTDITITASAELSISTPLIRESLLASIRHAQSIQKRLDPSISRFYFIGLAEQDPLKAFLYHFLFLERYTHHTFQKVVPPQAPGTLLSIPTRLTNALSTLSAEIVANAKSLVPRFVLCALYAWPTLSDQDVTAFKALKVERDRLSHGEQTTVDRAIARSAQDLAAKVVRAAIPPS